MASDSSGKKGFVAGLVTAAVITTGILAAVQIFDRITSNNARITAEGTFTKIVMPEPIINELRKQNEKIPLEEIAKLLPEKWENRTSVASSIAELVNKQSSRDALFTLSRLDNFLEFNIQNDGGKEAFDLKLELPLKGYYTLSRRGEKAVTGTFEHIISIGNLRPTNTVSIQVWSGDIFSEYYTDDAKVTYPDGVVSINFPTSVKGWYASLYNNLFGLILLTLFGLIFLGIFALAYIQYKQETRTKEVTTGVPKNDSETSSDAGIGKDKTSDNEEINPT